MPTDASRRTLIAGLAAGAAALTLARPAFALNTTDAKALINNLVAEINRVINSGASVNSMISQFETIFDRFADVPIIARAALGLAFRQASDSQRAAYTSAFRGYISRKYGKRFREFIGGQIEVTSARSIKAGIYEVSSIAKLRGETPFDLVWLVSDKSGRNLFFNMIIDGVNMGQTERAEIGAMLDRNHGNIEGLIADLKKAG